jgi:Protein of unknown function (DUF1186)/SEC-C motif
MIGVEGIMSEREPEALPPEVIWDRIAWRIERVDMLELEQVREDKASYVPLMLKSLRAVAAEPARYAQEWHHGHECALAFLAEFRAREAFIPIVEFLEAIRGHEELLGGDIITEDVPSILAATFDGNLERLQTLILNESLDEFVRASALKAIGILVTMESVGRDDLSRFLGVLSERLPRDGSTVWNEIVTQILHRRFVEHRKLAEDLIAADLTDWWEPEAVSEAFDADEFETSDPAYWLIDDAVEDILDWLDCYWTDEGREDLEELEDEETLDDEDGGEPDQEITQPLTFIREAPKVGRNDPCPCGSGKKYKRCCG